jgi:hypothetical protein
MGVIRPVRIMVRSIGTGASIRRRADGWLLDAPGWVSPTHPGG